MSLSIGDQAPDFQLKNANAAKGEASMNLSDAMGEAGVVVVLNATIARTWWPASTA